MRVEISMSINSVSGTEPHPLGMYSLQLLSSYKAELSHWAKLEISTIRHFTEKSWLTPEFVHWKNLEQCLAHSRHSTAVRSGSCPGYYRWCPCMRRLHYLFPP